MDLIRAALANRNAAGVAAAPAPKPVKSRGRGPTKAERAKANEPGSRAMRKFICEEKPAKKTVKDHLEAIIAIECESSSEGE